MPSSEPPPPFRLNPLAFPVETDMRFRLLLIAAAGTTFGIANYALNAVLPSSISDNAVKTISTIGAMLIVLLLFGIAHQRAKRAAAVLVAREQWATFPPPGGDPLAQASLQRMSAHVNQIVQSLPAVTTQQLHYYWNDSSADRAETAGMAFGYRDRQYLCLNEGMHPAFLSAPHTKRFYGVLLHELSHADAACRLVRSATLPDLSSDYKPYQAYHAPLYPLRRAADRLGGYPNADRYSAATAATNHAIKRCTPALNGPY
jgi:hypothetical protein